MTKFAGQFFEKINEKYSELNEKLRQSQELILLSAPKLSVSNKILILSLINMIVLMAKTENLGSLKEKYLKSIV